ncbi:MAG: ABC transporter permease [Chloroflexota bacterium]|nr:ABC transporter permease [Chloroflexota bacterium]
MERQSTDLVGTAVVRPPGAVSRFLKASARAFQKNPNMLAGAVILVVMATIAIFAPLIAHQDPVRLHGADRFQPPSSRYWFGTDHVGRDVYARTIYGSRISLLVGASVAAIVASAGTVIGLIAGYFRTADSVVMRFMDGIMAFPTLLLALALIALLGGSVQNVIIVISVVDTPRMARVVRGAVLMLRDQEFITAARAIGVGPSRVMALHILPNALAPIIVQATFVFASAVIVEASLSFLGAGTPPEIPTWGNIMGVGRTYIQIALWITFFPGLFLSLTALAINLMGDGLRDALDPRLARRA